MTFRGTAGVEAVIQTRDSAREYFSCVENSLSLVDCSLRELIKTWQQALHRLKRRLTSRGRLLVRSVVSL